MHDVLKGLVVFMLRVVGGLALMVLLVWLGLVAVGTFGYLLRLTGAL